MICTVLQPLSRRPVKAGRRTNGPSRPPAIDGVPGVVPDMVELWRSEDSTSLRAREPEDQQSDDSVDDGRLTLTEIGNNYTNSHGSVNVFAMTDTSHT